MSLISKIDANFLRTLSGVSSTDRRTADAVGGLTSSGGASSGGVDLSIGLDRMRTAFSQSVVRMGEALGNLREVKGFLEDFVGLTEELVDLAKRASDASLTDADRKRLQTRFNKVVKDFRDIQKSAEYDEVDLLDRSDLKKILEDAGLDLNAASALAQTFKVLAKSDGQLGYSKVFGEDLTLLSSTYRTVGDGTFAAKQDYGTGALPSGVAIADFDGDETLDLVTGNDTDNNISVLLGNSDGTFGAASSYSGANSIMYVDVGDVDRDGNKDVVAASYDDSTAEVFLGNGDGTFQASDFYSTGANPRGISLVLVDNDNVLDIVTTDDTDGTVSVLTGNADGTFNAATPYTVQNNPYHVGAEDFDKDGDIDLAVANNGSGSISVLIGKGDGTFAAQDIYSLPAGSQTVHDVAFGDFDEDGNMDIATISSDAAAKVQLLMGVGDGTFTTDEISGEVLAGTDISVGDFDADDHLDLAISDQSNNVLRIVTGNGDGTFDSSVSYATDTGPNRLTIGDFNGDGVSDVAVTAETDDKVDVFIGDTTTQTRNVLETASAPSDPLNNDISTRAKAFVAEDQLTNLLKDIKADLKNLSSVIEEVEAAQTFALQGFLASEDSLARINTFNSTEDLVNDLLKQITLEARDSALGAHSDLDTQLSIDLLEEKTNDSPSS